MNKRKFFGKIRMPSGTDKGINISMMILLIFGLLMVPSASMGIAVGNNQYLIRIVIKQLLFSTFGYVGMLIMARKFSFDLFYKYFNTTTVVFVIAFIMTVFSRETYGAKAWIQVPLFGVDITIQPSEFLKIYMILLICIYLGDNFEIKEKPFNLYGPVLISIIGFCLFILLFQKDLGSAAVVFVISFACLLIPKNKQLRKFQNIILVLIFIGLIFTVYILSPLGTDVIKHLPLQGYQINRILSSINPFIDRYGIGYQLINGLISFASGGFFGLGFGNSIRKYTDFPAANTDFILAIVVEELGYFGFLIIFFSYLIIIIRLFKYAFKVKNEKAQILFVGTAMYMLVHFLFNVGGVTGFIPLTGVPLLMISSGGSSTLSLMVAIGISQAIIRKINMGEIQ